MSSWGLSIQVWVNIRICINVIYHMTMLRRKSYNYLKRSKSIWWNLISIHDIKERKKGSTLQIKADFFNLVKCSYKTHHTNGETLETFFLVIAKRKECSLSLLLFKPSLEVLPREMRCDDFYIENLCARESIENLELIWKIWQDCWI